MHLRKITAAVTGILLLFTFALTANAAISSVGDPGQQWAIPNDAARGEHIAMFIDTQPGEQPSYLLNPATPSTDNQGRDYLKDPTCLSAQDPRCVGLPLQFQSVIPYCQSAADLNCVADFGTIDSSGARTSAAFSRYFPTKALNEYTGDPSLHLPSGVAGSVFSLPGAPHDGGNLYYLAVGLKGVGSSTAGFTTSDFQARIYPVQLQTVDLGSSADNQIDAGFSLSNRGRADGTKYWGFGQAGFTGKQFCVAESDAEKKCAARFAFPSGIKFYLKVRLQKLPGGWMHGRIQDPTISITQGSGYSELDVSANPVAVPVVYKMYNWNDMPTALRANYDLKTGAYVNDPSFLANPAQASQGGRSAPNPDPLQRNVIISSEASSSIGMEQLKLWLPYVNDQATALLSYWSVHSLSEGEMSGTNSCFSDPSSVTGIVTTNSTQYSAGPPSFDKSQGVLNYSVAAPHFTTTKDVFQGSYDLLMRSDVARCIYGFSKAPVKAVISVTSADGSPQTATTVLSETSGWIHLAANGFQFSSPSIQVKLSQDAPPQAPTPTPTPTATPEPTPSASPTPVVTSTAKPVVSAAKKLTITCVKGKTTKTVTAVKPVCPMGYKRK